MTVPSVFHAPVAGLRKSPCVFSFDCFKIVNPFLMQLLTHMYLTGRGRTRLTNTASLTQCQVFFTLQWLTFGKVCAGGPFDCFKIVKPGGRTRLTNTGSLRKLTNADPITQVH